MISPKPLLMLAHTTPKMTTTLFSCRPTRMKLSRENPTTEKTRILQGREGAWLQRGAVSGWHKGDVLATLGFSQ